jgi:hypothetical protein
MGVGLGLAELTCWPPGVPCPLTITPHTHWAMLLLVCIGLGPLPLGSTSHLGPGTSCSAQLSLGLPGPSLELCLDQSPAFSKAGVMPVSEQRG